MADNTAFNTGSGGDTLASDDIGGVKYERAKLVHGIDGTNDGDVAKTNTTPVIIANTGRTDLRFHARVVALGASGVEAALTMTKSAGTGATSSASSFVVTSGKRFKITGIFPRVRGADTTNSANAVTFNMRVSTFGAVSIATTPVIFSFRVCQTLRNAFKELVNCAPDDQAIVPFDGIEIPGDGTLQFGLTINPSYNSAGTVDLIITGYEY